MPNKSRATFIAFAACCLSLVAAQDTTVKCSYADWTTNARGQSPCLVWAELQTKCDPGGVRVTPLASSRYHYTEPDEPREINDCNCSVVAYNLMAACTWCQLGIADKWVNETVWRSQCPSYNSRGLSIDASDLTIPSWATIPVDGGMWRPNIASLAASPPTVTPTAATATAEFTPQSTADTHSPHANSDKGSNAGAIAGGVVAAALLIALFAALFIFFIRRSRRRAEIEARLRSSRRSSRSNRGGTSQSRPRSQHAQTKPASEFPSPAEPKLDLTTSPSLPTAPEMAYHPRCNHGIVAIAGAGASPRASTSTAAPTAVDEGGRTPHKSADQMV